MWLVKHLDNDSIRISAVEGGATVPVDFKGVDDLDTARAKFLF